MTHYDNLSKQDKLSILNSLYHDEQLSWAEVAKRLNITVDKARKQGKKLGIKSRDKSSAQKVALQTGRSEHRTEGRKRSEQEKMKISEGVGRVWDGLTEEELEERRQWAKEAWDNKSELEKWDMQHKSSLALNRASRLGSKLELFLFQELTKLGHKIELHKTHLLRNINLSIDLLIPKISVAIEVDGPNHFEPIRGEEELRKTIATDRQKTGLILSEGLCLIRIKQQHKLSKRYMRQILDQLLPIVNSLSNSYPTDPHKRYFEI